MTIREISEELNISQRTIKRDLANMQKNGIISRQGSDKTGVWVILSDAE